MEEQKVIVAVRDHKETFTSKELQRCENFIPDGDSYELGVDDMYVQVYTSTNINGYAYDLILDNIARIWTTLTEGITFTSLNDLVEQASKIYEDEMGEDLELD